jgi:hypothetical protein
MKSVNVTEVQIVLRRRRERDELSQQIRYAGYDIYWPCGQPVGLGLRRFCQQGTRLLLGRSRDPEEALVRLRLYPVDGLEAPLTRPGPGVRCRRFYALDQRETIQLFFFTGAPTEVHFDRRRDEAAVLDWLQAARIRHGTPFWFDLACEVLREGARVPGAWEASFV